MKRYLLVAFVLAATPAAADPGPHAAMDEVLAHCLAMRRDLAADRAGGLAGHARGLEAALSRAGRLAASWKGEKAPFLRQHIQAALRALSEGRADFASGELERVRKQFFNLSKPLIRYVGWFRARDGRYRTFYCSMKKAAWIQEEAKPGNPYYGAKMLECGERVRTHGEPMEAPAAQPPARAKEQPAPTPAQPMPPGHRH
jgi:Cu(I)/Ag(I) efflux system membrane fusion protein